MPGSSGVNTESAENAVAPHPLLPRHYGERGQRQPLVNQLFDTSARHYDRINLVFGLGAGTRYRRAALKRGGLGPGMSVADIGCGTGVIARHALDIVGSGGDVIGVDPSEAMRRNATRRRGIKAVAGTADRIPVDDASIDFISMGYALRHVEDLSTAFAEFRRVLRPGGRVLILEITVPESRMGYRALRFYLKTIVPPMTRIVTGNRHAAQLMDYHWDSIDQCVPPERVLESLRDAGFDAQRRVELGIFSEYSACKSAAMETPDESDQLSGPW